MPRELETCSLELLRATREKADELRLPMATHAAYSIVEFYETVREHRRTPIELLEELGMLRPTLNIGHGNLPADSVRLNYPGARDLALMGAAKVSISHCPINIIRRARVLDNWKSYTALGVNIALGSDTYPRDMIQNMRTASYHGKTMSHDYKSATAAEVFAAATLNGARSLGRDDLGRLAPGARADIILIDLTGRGTLRMGPVRDPVKSVVECGVGDDVDTVIVAGEVRMQGGRIPGVDLDAIRARAQAAGERVWANWHRSDPLGRTHEEAAPVVVLSRLLSRRRQPDPSQLTQETCMFRALKRIADHRRGWPSRPRSPPAQTDYPSKPVRIIVPFGAGGAADTLPRLLAQYLAPMWGQPVVVENRTGAAGNIGMELGARAAPDGYTLTSAPVGNLAINPHLYSKLTFDVLKDFTPITLDRIGAERARPQSRGAGERPEGADRVREGAAGQAHLRLGRRRHAGAHRRRDLRVDGRRAHGARRLQGRGRLGARSARRPDRHDLRADPGGEAAHRQRQTARARRREPEAHAGAAERADDRRGGRAAGVPGGVLVCAGRVRPECRPRSSAKIQTDAAKVIQLPEIRDRLQGLAAEPVGSTPAELAAAIKADYDRYGTIIRRLGIKAD